MSKQSLIEERKKRDLLLALDGKMRISAENRKSDLTDLLFFYEGCPSGMEMYLKPELMIANMAKDWLVEVSVDENGLLRVKDLATQADWQAERAAIHIKKLREKFGFEEYWAKQVLGISDET